MNAPVPRGLINVIPTPVNRSVSAEPADVIYERYQILHNFWKVHDAKSRVTRDPSDIRCRDLFWRIWGTQTLARNLSAANLTEALLRRQQAFNLSPFELDLPFSSEAQDGVGLELPSSQATLDSFQRPINGHSRLSDSSSSISPLTGDFHHYEPDGSVDSSKDSSSGKSHKRTNSQSGNIRGPLNRTSSTSRKRTSFVAAGTKARTRPSIGRKRSSQTAVLTSQAYASQRRPHGGSRRTSVDDSVTTNRPGWIDTQSDTKIPPDMLQLERANTNDDRLTRLSTVSAFELPSVSSWQSDDSGVGRGIKNSKEAQSGQESSSLLVDKSFREKFLETQKNIQSSSNLASMNRMKKTGSVVRFADEVNLPEELQRNRSNVPPSPLKEQNRPYPPQHRDSVGSIAAISDDGSEEEFGLPRTKSQLSLMIQEMKRKQSDGIEDQRNFRSSIMKHNDKRREEEEEKLLAMGRRDGVTKAGGVQLPRPQRLEKAGKFAVDDNGYESPEEPLY